MCMKHVGGFLPVSAVIWLSLSGGVLLLCSHWNDFLHEMRRKCPQCVGFDNRNRRHELSRGSKGHGADCNVRRRVPPVSTGEVFKSSPQVPDMVYHRNVNIKAQFSYSLT